MDIINLTVERIHKGLKAKEFTCTELIQETFKLIENIEPKVRAFITLTKDYAFHRAKEVDWRIKKGENLRPLEGIPYSAKDVFCTKGIETTAGSGILEDFISPYDATAIKKIDKSGAILIGKTNCDPFGFGSSTENSYYQTTHNPWDIGHVPGGSSGGSAAAVASGIGVFSLGEDTGGSIRQPACFCSVLGMKVTYGLVSRYGVTAYGSSLDTIGVFARDSRDLALVLQIMAGKDEYDATTTLKKIPPYSKNITNLLRHLKIGLPEEYFTNEVDSEIKKAVDDAACKLESLGHHLEEISLPNTKYAIAAYYLSGISEVSANLARYDGIRFGYSDQSGSTIESVYFNSRGQRFSDEEKRRIMVGAYALSAGYYDAYYNKAQQVRTLLRKDFEEKFKDYDCIVAPVSPVLPFKIGENTDDPLKMWLVDAFTVTINPSGIPSLAVPCGFAKNGLPIGMQLIGPMYSEELLLQIAYQYQKITDWHLKRPQLNQL